MPKVSLVEPQKKNPKRFNVYLDGLFAFGADEDLIVNFRLLPGKEIESGDLEKLVYEAQVGKLMERMYRLFGIRQRTEKEVRNYFRIKNYQLGVKREETISDLVVDQVIDRLKKKGMINDESFALSWVEARRRSKKKGDRVLRLELIQKGIEKGIIDKVLGENRVDQESLAMQALEKKLPTFLKLDGLNFKKRSYQYLLRRGFEFEVVKGLVEKLLKRG